MISQSTYAFFFQAEDGIRDGRVTGVQTCALPISAALIDEIPVLAVLGAATGEGLTVKDAGELRVKETDRSEERRVGKECRSRGAGAEEKKESHDQSYST